MQLTANRFTPVSTLSRNTRQPIPAFGGSQTAVEIAEQALALLHDVPELLTNLGMSQDTIERAEEQRANYASHLQEETERVSNNNAANGTNLWQS
jgi:uncharacterized protein YecA (UPF0149 family)